MSCYTGIHWNDPYSPWRRYDPEQSDAQGQNFDRPDPGPSPYPPYPPCPPPFPPYPPYPPPYPPYPPCPPPYPPYPPCPPPYPPYPPCPPPYPPYPPSQKPDDKDIKVIVNCGCPCKKAPHYDPPRSTGVMDGTDNFKSAPDDRKGGRPDGDQSKTIIVNCCCPCQSPWHHGGGVDGRSLASVNDEAPQSLDASGDVSLPSDDSHSSDTASMADAAITPTV